MTEPMISVNEVAERLGVSPDTIYRLKNKPNGLRAYRVGRCIRFRPEEVDAYIAAQAVEPVTQPMPFGKQIHRFRYVPGMKVVGV